MLDSLDQEIILKKMSLQAYKARLFYRLSIFSYKIVNNTILRDFNDNLIKFVDNTKSQRIRALDEKKNREKLIFITLH